MKLLKVFQTKKSQSPPWTSSHPSRTSSSSSNISSSPPHSADLSVAEMQKVSPDHQKSHSNSRRKRSVKNTLHSSAHHTELDDPNVSRPAPNTEHDKELADAFKVFDRNGDGKISVSELGAVLRSLGEDPSEEELHLMVEAVDADGDGHIDFQEFINLNTVTGDGPGMAARSEELRAAFLVFDIDRNNYISAKELHKVLSGLGTPRVTIEECGRMISGVDSDGDGLVDFEEFERMMTRNCVF